MKLTNVTATLKANAFKLLAATALAGAFLTAAAPAAQAQRFGFGVRIGGPAFYGPRYVAPPVVVYGQPYGYHRDWDDSFHHDFYRRDFYRHDWDRRDFDRRRHDWR